jgi:hypothetical protein
MAILDAAPYQTWISAWDNVERGRSRLVAAKATGNSKLISYVENALQKAVTEYNAALEALQDA